MEVEQSSIRDDILTDVVHEQLERFQWGPELPSSLVVSALPIRASAMSVEVPTMNLSMSLDVSTSVALPPTSFFRKRDAGKSTTSEGKSPISATGSATPVEKSQTFDFLLDFVSVDFSRSGGDFG